MGSAALRFELLVAEDIRRMVADAIQNGATLSTATCVAQIMAIYPNYELQERDVADAVIRAAVSAGVVVEIGAAKPNEGTERA